LYLVNVDADDWHGEDLGPVSTKLNLALAARGLPEYAGPAATMLTFDDGDENFEEKIYRDGAGFSLMIERAVGADRATDLLHWDLLVPVAFDGRIVIPEPSPYNHATTVASTQRVLAVMTALALRIGLPWTVPERSQNLEITTWFEDVESGAVTAADGPWRHDLDAAFHVAVQLRAAQFSMRWSCPIRWI
jgi:hypothetical protein